jgi:hypothetical protein
MPKGWSTIEEKLLESLPGRVTIVFRCIIHRSCYMSSNFPESENLQDSGISPPRVHPLQVLVRLASRTGLIAVSSSGRQDSHRSAGGLTITFSSKRIRAFPTVLYQRRILKFASLVLLPVFALCSPGA